MNSLFIDSDDELTCLKRFHNLHHCFLKYGKMEVINNALIYAYTTESGVMYSLVFPPFIRKKTNNKIGFMCLNGEQCDKWWMDYTLDWFSIPYNSNSFSLEESELVAEFNEFVLDYSGIE